MRGRLPDPRAIAAAFETAYRGLASAELKARADGFGNLMELAAYAGRVYEYLPSPYAYTGPVPQDASPDDIASDDVRLPNACGDADGCKLLARFVDSLEELSPREALDDLGDPYPVEGANYVGVTRSGALVRVTIKYSPRECKWTAAGAMLCTSAELPNYVTRWREKFEGKQDGVPYECTHPTALEVPDTNGHYTARLKAQARGSDPVIKLLCRRIEIAVRAMERRLAVMQRRAAGVTSLRAGRRQRRRKWRD